MKAENAGARLGELSERIKSEAQSAGIPFTVTIGYVDMQDADDILDIPAVVDLADKALYQAKDSGKAKINRFKRWDYI